VCHLNTCPVGIATQDPELRKKFTGTSDNVVNYFFYLAEEMREYMAGMGFRTMGEMIGRSDVLKTREAARNWKTRGLDLDAIFYKPEVPEDRDVRKTIDQDHNIDRSLDNELIEKSEPALDRGEPTQFEMPVGNTHRTVGGMLAGEIARRYGNEGLPDDTLRIEFHGVAGQSFGAWGTHGLTMRLTGAANDYAGKGLSGGRVVVKPDERAAYDLDGSIVTGNVALYGATGGEAYFRGNAGERFAVRNSGAHAVVEGVGDHGCEYMTGGVVVVLGGTGRNFAAGMSGGFAFVLDESGDFEKVCNKEMVGLESVESEDDKELLRSMIEAHLLWTGSEKARRVLDGWEASLDRFVKVMPDDLKRVLAEQQQADLERVDEEPDAELAEDLGVEGVEVSR